MTWEICAKGLARIRVENGYIYVVVDNAGNIALSSSLLFVPDSEKEKKDE
jgi:hypothetical protein